MISHCYGCPNRRVTYDENGKAHTCHETCEDHKNDQQIYLKARANRNAEARGNEIVSLGYERVQKKLLRKKRK